MSAAQAQASTPQLEACLRHALPLGAHLVVGVCVCVVANVPVDIGGEVTWYYWMEQKKNRDQVKTAVWIVL